MSDGLCAPYDAFQEKTMKTETVIIIMFVVFCLFVLANWLNRPRK